MKKIYNAPEITVVNLNTTNCLLSGSITINSNDGDSVDAGQAATRGARFSSWDDEEE